jgi:hypothetical protein
MLDLKNKIEQLEKVNEKKTNEVTSKFDN